VGGRLAPKRRAAVELADRVNLVYKPAMELPRLAVLFGRYEYAV